MEHKIIAAAQERGHPIPDELATALELPAYLLFYLEAFAELHTCRSMGFVEGYIPWTAIDRYAERQQITGEDFNDFYTMIRALDDVYLKFKQQQAEKSK